MSDSAKSDALRRVGTDGGGGGDRPAVFLAEPKPVWKQPTLRMIDIEGTRSGGNPHDFPFEDAKYQPQS